MSRFSDLLKSNLLLYQTQAEAFRLDVPTDGETVWLSLNQLATLFDRNKSTISRYITKLFEEDELKRNSVVATFATTAEDNKIYKVEHYNLDVIISVGYRVKSQRGTQFRIWATKHLREFLIKGFTMDNPRLKEASNSRYFEELLQRIRDIQSSEKVFWRKILDIFSTSVDYAPQSDQPNIGITNYPGNKLLKRDTEVAKNYLGEEELGILNRIVTAYLKLAEIQALNQVPVSMVDWLERLQQFLTMTGRDVLSHADSISREQALEKTHKEYDTFKQSELDGPSEAELHFLEVTEKELKQLEQNLKKHPPE